MPELPEVETVKSGLIPVMQGYQIKHFTLNRPDLRFPFPKNMQELTAGQIIKNISRRAKFLIFDLENNWSIVSHLGMSGRYVILPQEEQNHVARALQNTSPPFYHKIDRHIRHDHVIFAMSSGHKIIYNDPRRFGYMDMMKTDSLCNSKHFQNLGPEPMGNEFSEETFFNAVIGSSRPIKSVLLDQKFISGLGNIYVCEALFRCGIHPESKFKDVILKSNNMSNLVRHIKNVLREAIEAGGSSLRDHRQADGQLGYFQHSFSVYDREGQICVTKGCDAMIERIIQSGRSSFYCPKCQH